MSVFDVIERWGCIPEPEQQALVNLAELTVTPVLSASWSDVRANLFLLGGFPSDDRTDILFNNYGLVTMEDTDPRCGDTNGCIDIVASSVLGEIWSQRLIGGCQIGSPIQPPCYYALTAP